MTEFSETPKPAKLTESRIASDSAQFRMREAQRARERGDFATADKLLNQA